MIQINIKKKHMIILGVIIGMFALIFLFKTSFAYLYTTVSGEREYGLKVKGFHLKLDESSTGGNIQLENSEPMTDEAGKVTNAYTFSITNEDSSETGYILYLDDVEIPDEINRMKDTDVKYQWIENGVETVGFVSDLGVNPFRILSSGILSAGQKNSCSLRFWIHHDAEIFTGQVFSVKLRVIATSKDAIENGNLNPGSTIVTTPNGMTQISSEEFQTYVQKTVSNALNGKTFNIDKIYPVGSIYISTVNTNPSSLFGGSWESYGAGRALVGVGEGNDGTTKKSFVGGESGGEYNHILSIDEMPAHDNHLAGYDTGEPGVYIGIQNVTKTGTRGRGWAIWNGNEYFPARQSMGGSQPHNNLQPYIAVYMWKRTS